MNCPYCGFQFEIAVTNAKDDKQIEDAKYIPLVCQECANIGIMVKGEAQPRQLTEHQIEILKHSPTWPFIEQAVNLFKAKNKARAAKLN